MMHETVSPAAALGMLALFLWAGNVQAVPCQNNLPASNPDSVYIDHGNGTVTDTRTGLMWKQCAEGRSGATCETGFAEVFDWSTALAHAEASTFANYADWRLPNVKELLSLVEDCRVMPAINTNHFPNTPTWAFQSSSIAIIEAASGSNMWSVRFDRGNTRTNSRGLAGDLRVRLVRGGQ